MPDNLEAVITQQAEQAGFNTATDYLVHLVLREQDRLSQQAKDEWWEQTRAATGPQTQTTPLWQQVPPTEIAQRLRSRAATYTGLVSKGLPDAAFDRETIYGD